MAVNNLFAVINVYLTVRYSFLFLQSPVFSLHLASFALAKEEKKKCIVTAVLWIEGNCHSELVWLWFLQHSTGNKAE